MNESESSPPAAQQRQVSVSVRDLVEFVLRTGDLHGDRQFVSSSRAREGTEGHQRLQRAQPKGYEPEVPVSHSFERPGFILVINGRIDGVFRKPDGLLIEEIKTVAGRWDGSPDPLHWAQAKLYAALLLQSETAEIVEIQLSYLELESNQITAFREKHSRSQLNEFLVTVTEPYLAWIASQVDWYNTRDQSIASLSFPFAKYRPGQRLLAVASYRAARDGLKLFAEAPTGIGKTVSVLFASVKILAEKELAQIFYLTAKTVGRTVAQSALSELRRASLKIRSLTLTAREKLCLTESGPCDPQTCPRALGYYDRSKPAIAAALKLDAIDRHTLQSIAAAHHVCPFALSHDTAPWSDVVICDYNHVFDPAVYLKRFFTGTTGDYIFLIDEAHNLVDRAREMFSAELRHPALRETQQAIANDLPACSRALTQLLQAMTSLSAEPPSPPPSEDSGAFARKEFPQPLLAPLADFLQQAESWLAQNIETPFHLQLLQTYFDCRRFLRAAHCYDERFATLLSPGQFVRLFCIDPSALLQDALNRGQAALFFSATLSPIPYFQQLLGGEPHDPIVQLPSPFPAENFRVLIADKIQTHLKQREASCDQVCHAISQLVNSKTGNYLVYFPSYQYLEAVHTRFAQLFPHIHLAAQSSRMSEQERDDFLILFQSQPTETLVAFALLGGVFGEGIDLVGERLVGVVIVGVGLPQICLERNLIRQYADEKYAGAGFDYAYAFPGFNRVLQAVGRVIRSETDRGIALLIDSRFSQKRYRDLFPSWWAPTPVSTPAEISLQARQFWNA